jgi:DNA-binding IclR family transcriptional regulator
MKSTVNQAAVSLQTKVGRGRPQKANKSPVGIQAVDIALEVLKVLAARASSMSLSELARASSLQPSKLHRYMVSFARHGLVRQSSVTGEYDLGPLARTIGTAAFGRHNGLSVVYEVLSSLCAESGCTIATYIWTDLGPTLTRMEIGTEVQPVSLREGAALPLCGSAAGRVFLAYLPKALTRQLVKAETNANLEEGLPNWPEQKLESELEKIRASRIYWTSEAIFPASLAVAPIFEASGKLHSVFVVIRKRGQNKKPELQQLQKLIETKLDQLAQEFS